MKTLDQSTIGADPQEHADQEAVMRQLLEGIPADPEALRRVEECSRQATVETGRIHGYIDVDQLLREVRAES